MESPIEFFFQNSYRTVVISSDKIIRLKAKKLIRKTVVLFTKLKEKGKQCSDSRQKVQTISPGAWLVSSSVENNSEAKIQRSSWEQRDNEFVYFAQILEATLDTITLQPFWDG